MAAINLRKRVGLHGRLFDMKCPVLWLHGTDDVVYSVANVKEEMQLFLNPKEADLRVVDGGAHVLSASHPKEVDQAMIDFCGEVGKQACLAELALLVRGFAGYGWRALSFFQMSVGRLNMCS